MDRYCCKMQNAFRNAIQNTIHMHIRKVGWPYIFFFNPPPPYALSAGSRSSYIADFTMALKAIPRMRSLISSGVHSSLYNVATLTYFSWSRMRAVVRDDFEARESRSKSSSQAACVAPIISAAVLVGVNGLLNLRDFAGGGDSNESAARAFFFLAISCCFLCISII